MTDWLLAVGAWDGVEIASRRDASLARLLGTEAAVVLAATVAVALLVIARAHVRAWRVRRAESRLRSAADGMLATALALRAGMTAYLDTYAGGAPRRAPARVRSLDNRWVALSVASGPPECPVGTPVVVTAASEMAAYRFHGSIRDRRTVAGEPTIFIERPAWVERVQRRGHPRLPVDMPTTVTPLGAGPESPPAYRAVLQDLSAGGFRLVAAGELLAGMRVRVRLPIEAVNSACFEARVVAVSAAPPPFACSARCQFLGQQDDTRRLIGRYCVDTRRGPRARTDDAPPITPSE